MSPDSPLDQTACDREPIHIPGSIQPHGMLLVADLTSGQIVGGAGHLENYFGEAWPGQNIDYLLQFDVLAMTAEAPRADEIILGKLIIGEESFDLLGHILNQYLLVEIEPALQSFVTPEQSLSGLETIAHRFEAAPDVRTLFQKSVVAFRKLTGFDRVMIYQFLEDGSGVVLAEDGNDNYPTFLNHHFPASDIPKQARALYLRNRVRVIPDSSYIPAPLRWYEDAPQQPLDLSDVALRSVSPIHLQYLRNMGVAASASVSIIRDGVLWGLIACHNATPLAMPFATRTAARALAASLARQMKSKDDAENARERLRLRSHEDRLVAALLINAPLEERFTETADNLRQTMLADGFAVVSNGKLVAQSGTSPDIADLRSILAMIQNRFRDGLFYSHEFGLQKELPAHMIPLASGIAVLKLYLDEDVFLVWSRAEKVQIVEWAGNPHKDNSTSASAPLTPRASFDAWSEEVRGRSRYWNFNKIDAMHRIGRIIHEAYQRRRIDKLNRELQRTLEQQDKLLEQKDFLMKEINHRVQNSLQLVSTFLGMQMRETDDPLIVQYLTDARSRIAAVALVHRRLYSDSYVGSVDLARYLDELSNELFQSMGEEWRSHHTSKLSHVLINADRAINIGLVYSELVTNANKYAYDGAPGPTSVTLDQHFNQARLVVADSGTGKTRSRAGFGSKMLKAIVLGLGGEMEELDNSPGLKVVVTVPIEL
ncbi:histidine kinase dimerization/phosphoacceptor domain -containing protein [Brucella rhizosphaerae]|nr:histidine kinase dimerization/phosphoacceptor domain -containing protein [Brucella rhizosphaerae]